MSTRDVENDGPRYWVVDPTPGQFDHVPDSYVGLADENNGGVGAWGPLSTIEEIARKLNEHETMTGGQQ